MHRAPGGAEKKGKVRFCSSSGKFGNSVKVAAVDVATLTEVSIVGAAGASEETLKRTAINKLKYVLDKQGGGRKGGS